MYRVSVQVVLVAFLVGAINAGDDASCGSQYEHSYMCKWNLKDTDEMKVVLDKMKDACKICVPDYPKQCQADWETMGECCKTLTAKAKMADDPECVALKSETLSKVNKCFETEPQNPLNGLEKLFIPPGMKQGMMTKKERNDSSSMEESNDEIMSKVMPDFSEWPMMRPECLFTKEQHTCKGKEMAKAYKTDSDFAEAVDDLMKKQEKCKKKITHQCELSTTPLKKCFFDAQAPLFKKIFEKMTTCIKAGGKASRKRS